MDLLVVVDGVIDYGAWRKVFDEDEAERAKFSDSMEAGPLDNNKVAIVAYGGRHGSDGSLHGNSRVRRTNKFDPNRRKSLHS